MKVVKVAQRCVRRRDPFSAPSQRDEKNMTAHPRWRIEHFSRRCDLYFFCHVNCTSLCVIAPRLFSHSLITRKVSPCPCHARCVPRSL
jgi:hypothetical protein